MSENKEQYQNLLAELIQKEMAVFGPNIALDKAQNVAGLKVGGDGAVLGLSGDPALVLKALAAEYAALSPQVAKSTMASVLEKHPEIKV